MPGCPPSLLDYKAFHGKSPHHPLQPGPSRRRELHGGGSVLQVWRPGSPAGAGHRHPGGCRKGGRSSRLFERKQLPRVRESELRRAVDLLGIDCAPPAGIPGQGSCPQCRPGADPRAARRAAAPLPARCGHHLRPQRVQPAPRPYRHQPIHLGRHRGGRRPPLAAGGRRAPPGDPAAVDAAAAAGRDRGRPALGKPSGSRFSGGCPGLVGPKGRGLAGPPHPAPLHQSDLVRSSRSGTGAVSSEPFRQAWGPPLTSRPETDLFAGMEAGAGATPPDSR